MTMLNKTIISLLLCLGLLSSTVQAADKVTYIHNDALGSPVAATDANGKLLWREDYKPYGERIRKEVASKDNTLWYTGKPHEEDFGLSYFGARWYSPQMGRFTGLDPAGFSEGNVQSFNRYAYANNNPYVYVDPNGLAPKFRFGRFNLYNMPDAGFGPGRGPNGQPAGVGGIGEPSLKKWNAEQVQMYKNSVAKSGTTVIGRVKDLQNLKKGEQSLLNRLPDRGSAKANWKQNSGVIRQEISKGKPIRDASPGDKRGQFLNAERNLLESRGWTFDKGSSFWNPPKP